MGTKTRAVAITATVLTGLGVLVLLYVTLMQLAADLGSLFFLLMLGGAA